ncbi:hypothetical protein LAZ67_15000847 [Cordylochernes scorpioides]|uniref:Uncharacterized protein n=1 Tax=Cordylochernes scorpioides TaxID=51811 RepID=A0ABY6L8M3_9ARAC|nr:hypothetical protein LAZ67_15000847 [Cordylochernes scorpioides]
MVRFHQDISSMEKPYQGKWSPGILADYCWTLKKDVPQQNIEENPLPFEGVMRNMFESLNPHPRSPVYYREEIVSPSNREDEYLSPEQRSEVILDMAIVGEICPTLGRDIIPDDPQWDSSDENNI